MTERWQGDRRLLFVLNHTEQEQEVPLDRRYADLLHGSTFEGTVSIAPRAALVLLEQGNGAKQ